VGKQLGIETKLGGRLLHIQMLLLPIVRYETSIDCYHGAFHLKTYFEFAKHGASYKRETLAGIATFLTMAYIIIVNPAILEAASIPRGPSMTATILSAVMGTLIMGLYAKRTFAIAPVHG
jgi:hypothetical protein